MNEPNSPPNPPPPLPQINHKLLWLSLLGPPIVVGLLTAFTFGVEEMVDFFYLTATLGVSVVVAGWILFWIVLKKRIRGMSFVLSVIGYPMAQFSICFAIFFFGCLATIY